MPQGKVGNNGRSYIWLQIGIMKTMLADQKDDCVGQENARALILYCSLSPLLSPLSIVPPLILPNTPGKCLTCVSHGADDIAEALSAFRVGKVQKYFRSEDRLKHPYRKRLKLILRNFGFGLKVFLTLFLLWYVVPSLT